MPKFRKKPVEIEAVLHTAMDDLGPEDGICPSFQTEPPKWMQDAFNDGTLYWDNSGLKIKTLEGDHSASVGDWIIRGVKGELYPCKPDIFAATYDEVA